MFEMKPIGYVESARVTVESDFWGGVESRMVLTDAVNGTPVLDIKPVMMEFLPRTKVWQPEWSQELMRDYWKHSGR